MGIAMQMTNVKVVSFVENIIVELHFHGDLPIAARRQVCKLQLLVIPNNILIKER